MSGLSKFKVADSDEIDTCLPSSPGWASATVWSSALLTAGGERDSEAEKGVSLGGGCPS